MESVIPSKSSSSRNGGTPAKLYITPQIEKRKDGLCPSLLPVRNEEAKPLKPPPGAVNKPYRTNSMLLLQIKEKKDTSREECELQTITDSISSALKEIVNPDEGEVISLSFKPMGCIWKMEFDPSLNGADKNYRIEVIMFANQIAGVTNYEIDTILMPRIPVDPNPLAPPLKGFKEVKEIFDGLALSVRKAVVRLEFPRFPEGCQGRPFREVYQLNARLKSGSFATVCRGTHRETGRKVAIKCVLRKDLPPADDAAIYDEVAILASLNHPHIVPIVDFFDEADCYFIIMELMGGGDLFDRIGKKKSYSEADARDLVIKMLKAVAYCHNRKVAHCDLKPKNLLLSSEENDSFIKLADFGFAARVHETKSLTKQCGTPFFVAPEILTRKPYDHQSDMWSVGCIVYLLLSGNLPFMGRSQKELFRKIVAGKYEFSDDAWQDVSEDARELVKKMLVLNPDDRITAKDALRHPWLRLSKDRLSLVMLQGTSQRLKTFNARMKLRSAMIACDWIIGLKRSSFASMRNINSDASTASVGSHGSNPVLDKMAKQREREEQARKKLAHLEI